MARGGKREGAGRKPGIPSTKTVKRLAVAEQAIAEGKTPIEVMLDNMRHFQKVALDAEVVIEQMSADNLEGLGETPEQQFKALLAKVKSAAGLRQMAHECARDAAPYLHHKLTAITHTGTGEGGAITFTWKPPQES